ncbi:MAG: acetyl/propionyl/methylcrotonyl-CoA carboxylase subunit alpha [Hyphomicrobiales bacterium]|nr:acetyl/propionyl/methylcrotonyl-CoA carboxylase subunit alpha [Hyphomicrobiales bacterium]MCP5373918.1 acetyl/propionyl/methylcrotonyl-CoA carboxylase subunit alpha [Hyphomicrobiales bacterium]
MFKKILIANRGEIACRVIKTARRMGIKTVAVYSEADVAALHTDMADEAMFIGPPPSSESYLVMDRIVQACLDSGAEAVHPGYGFLSENATFARKLARNKITLIGPKPNAMTAMGDKIESKKLAMAAGVNTIPGHTEALKDEKEALKVARKIGYPVMMKASAGGGGKGMRVAFSDDEVREGFGSAVREAMSSFGDDRVFIEKYIQEPRHIEIQVMGDSHGNVIYLGERECSVQRRHQKVIEEAPSPFVTVAMRRAMGEQAVALAKAVNYQSAGTVEFIVDKDRNFFFLEMNTRLQVEHPVTEFVTGLDLVEIMIKVAAGEKLPLTQEQVELKGWAVEARIYAEDPFRNFLPSTGRLVRYLSPEEGPFVRVDTGVYEGGEISIYYDPMIAKLITTGATRDHALDHMRRALDEFYIYGVNHNIDFLSALVSHPRFVTGKLTTNFIAEEYPDGFHPADLPHEDPDMMVAVAAAVHRRYQERAAAISGQLSGHERQVHDDWVVFMGGEYFPVRTIRRGEVCEVTISGEPRVVEMDWNLGEQLIKAKVDSKPVCIKLQRMNVAYRLFHAGSQVDVLVLSPKVAEYEHHMPVKEPPDLSKFLLSPMPGLLVSLAVAEGDEVKAGEELCIVEAMKMENVLRAQRDGVVQGIKAAPGDSLMVDQVILEFA